MATGKKFYWIKIKDSFMTSDKVDFLMSQKNGANYVVLYQMLCLKTINTAGELARSIGEIIMPFDELKIQRDCKYFEIDTIRIALELYKRLGMIYSNDNGILQITDFKNMVGSETDYASQKRIQRNYESKMLGADSSVDNVHIENRDKILDIRDKEKDIKDIVGKSRFTPPTHKEVDSYIKAQGYDMDANRFIDFYESKGWMVGKNKMKNWQAAVRNWSKDKPKTKGRVELVTQYPTMETSDFDEDALNKAFKSLGGS